MLKVFSRALGALVEAGIIGMVGGVDEGFGVGHQAENFAGGITDTGYVVQGTVGIKRKCASGWVSIGKRILKHRHGMVGKLL